MIVTIKNDKIAVTGYGDKDGDIQVTDLPLYLRYDIEIDDNVTFERVFNIIIENMEIFNTIFASSLGNHPIELYVEEFKKNVDEDDTSIDYLEVCHATDIWKYKGKKEISHYYDFHGIGKDATYAIEFSGINNLKNYPIKINNEIVYSNFSDKRKKFITQLRGVQRISVFDFFDAILYEISWFGTPENRKNKKDELDDTCRRLDLGEIETYEMFSDDEGSYIIKDGEKDYLFKKND